MAARKGQTYRHLPAFILLTLAEGKAHGGAIYNGLKKSLPVFECDSGAIYRTLQNLENEGEVAFQWDTSGAGPAKKIYIITEAGLKSLEKWKEDIEQRLANLNYFIDSYKRIKDNEKDGKRNDCD